MENSLKGLILAAGTIITCVVISLGFYISRQAKNTASAGTGQIDRINTEFAESDKVIYDGCDVSGSEVISVIRKMRGGNTGVYVETATAVNYYIQIFDTSTGEIMGNGNATYSSDTTSESSDYINPYATFSGIIVRDANDVITGIMFKQKL